eukprot:5861438-Prorocentrum_lima.AAC.1
MHFQKKGLLDQPPRSFQHSIHAGEQGRTTLLVHSPRDLRAATAAGVEAFEVENPPVIHGPAAT